VVTILNQIYEVDFRGFSYGFRPGRSPHQALDALNVGIGFGHVDNTRGIPRKVESGDDDVGIGSDS